MKSTTIQKRTKIRSLMNEIEDSTIHTKVSYYTGWLGVVGMIILGIRHFNDVDLFGEMWGRFAIFLGCLGVLGMIMIDILDGKGFEFPPRYQTLTARNLLNTGMLFVGLIVIQILIQLFQFSVSNTEKALYFVFAAVIEELFFRGFLVNLISPSTRTNIIRDISAVIFSALCFAAIHQNYYDELNKLAGIFIGGILFGAFYIWRRDLTANILAHFILNTWSAIVQYGVVNV